MSEDKRVRELAEAKAKFAEAMERASLAQIVKEKPIASFSCFALAGALLGISCKSVLGRVLLMPTVTNALVNSIIKKD